VKCRACPNEYSEPEIIDGLAYFVCSECGDVHEVKNYHPHTKEQLIEIINVAFSKVSLGDGIGLLEAQALDNYESEEVQKKQREKDEKSNWKSIPYDVLQNSHSSLSFFDANGFRFHLPAYIVGSINGKVDDPIFHLTDLEGYASSKLVTLSSNQKNAVISYLTWCLTEDEYQFDYEEILIALNKFWC
jgi:hypothetical protein